MMTSTRLGRLLASCLLLLLTSCGALTYDLSAVPVPVSAKPMSADDIEQGRASQVVPFEIKGRNQLIVHGLFGHSQPDIARLVTEASEGYDRIAGFRVEQKAGFSHWLLTHLSLTLWRMKSVVISGQLVRD